MHLKRHSLPSDSVPLTRLTVHSQVKIDHPGKKILKKERGVWIGEEMLLRLQQLTSARQYMIYNKIEPVAVQNVNFVR